MEDSAKFEDIEPNNIASGSSQVNQTFLDTRPLVDNKNTQVRVVRGSKKLKLDNSDHSNTEKKGMLEKYRYKTRYH